MGNQLNRLPALSNVEVLILRMLVQYHHLYGLEMVEKSDGKLKRGTIYVALSRMQDKGLVESRTEARTSPEIGIPRRVYSMSGFGERVLAALEAAQSTFQDYVAAEG